MKVAQTSLKLSPLSNEAYRNGLRGSRIELASKQGEECRLIGEDDVFTLFIPVLMSPGKYQTPIFVCSAQNRLLDGYPAFEASRMQKTLNCCV
ncbi:hypothetical protein HPB48_010376 [Haemaphysalis longicornis]|uniref:Uncharacterized protein n=1 Tax=Haemaphysalis longicornis TaxID=44386 RepID=A0A9J6GMC9_HAELO|nr:hypothetical protein HPB48_010376 [Haemaphysalis longicornis]